MLCRCWRHCGAVVLTIASILRYATGYTSQLSCRSYEALADLLPDPEEVKAPADPKSFARFKEFVASARTPDFLLQATDSAAEAGISMMAACDAAPYRSRRRPKEGPSRRLRQHSLGNNILTSQLAKIDYLTEVDHVLSAEWIYRRGPIVQKFAGMGVAASPNSNYLTAGDPNKTFITAPTGVIIDHDTGNMYVAVTGQGVVQKLTKKDGYNVTTLFNGRWQNVSEAERIVEMSCLSPSAVAFDPVTGDLYVSDEDNSRVFRVKTKAADGSHLTADQQSPDTVGVVVNADGYRGMSGDCSSATLAKMRKPRDLAIIPPHKGHGRSLAIADSGNNRIRTIEITDWPFCIDKTGYDCTTAPEVIDPATGNLCSSGSDCGIAVDSPDSCAFQCRHFGSGKYPLKLPQVDLTFTADDVQNLFLGCLTMAKDSVLLDCTEVSSLSLEVQKTWFFNSALPPYSRYYTLRVDFTMQSGTVIHAGQRLMGAVVGGRLKAMNFTEVQPTFWKGLGGTFRIAYVNVQTCGMWSYKYTPPTGSHGVTNAGGVFVEHILASETMARAAASGKCYLLAADNASTTCDESGSDIFGYSDCRPGKIETILGGGAPGLSPTAPTLGATDVMMNALDMRLRRPSGMTIINDGANMAPIQAQYPKLNMMVSDTANDRIVAKTLMTAKEYNVRFWLFIAGEDVEYFVNSAYETVISWSIHQVLGWNVPFHVVREIDMSADAREVFGAQTSCDKDIEDGYDFFYKKTQTYYNKIYEFCDASACSNPPGEERKDDTSYWKTAGFTSKGCCLTFCMQSMITCAYELLEYRASLRSVALCGSYDKAKVCIDNMIANGVSSSTLPTEGSFGGCTSVPGGSVDQVEQVFFPLVLGINTSTNFTLLEEACDGISMANAVGCNGMCDLKMADILGVNHEWIGSNDTSKPAVGLLIEITMYDRNEFVRVREAVNQLKMQDTVVQGQQSSKEGWNYPSSYDDRTQWGPGTLLYTFMNFWFLISEISGFPGGKYKVTFSAANGYDRHGAERFGLTTEVYPHTAIWIYGNHPLHKLSDDSLNKPGGLVFDRALRPYIADVQNFRILRLEDMFSVGATQLVEIAGRGGYSSFNGNGLLASMTGLSLPTYVAMDSNGVLMTSDSKHHEIRQVLGLSWNLACSHSNQYMNLLSNATTPQKNEVLDLLRCRDAQVRIEIMALIDHCRKKWFLGDSDEPFDNRSCVQKYPQKNAVYSRIQSDLRNIIFQAPPDCTVCLNQLTNPKWGCGKPQAGLSWNNTEDTWGANTSNTFPGMPIRGYPKHHANGEVVVNDESEAHAGPYHDYYADSGDGAPTDMLFEMTWLLNDIDGAILLQAMEDIQARIANSATELFELNLESSSGSSGTQLKPYLDAVIIAAQDQGAAKMHEAINNLKTALCQEGRNYNPRGRMLLYQWYLQITNICVQIADSKNAGLGALVGGQFYDPMSLMVEHVFGLVTDFHTETDHASICHPGCGLLHPRFFSDLPWLYPPGSPAGTQDTAAGTRSIRETLPPVGPRFGQCCGYGGYLCGRAEGPCQIAKDCKSGFTCVKDSCLWGKGESCCQGADSTAAQLTMEEAANTIGYKALHILTGA